MGAEKMTERVETSPNLIWSFEDKPKLPNSFDKKEFNYTERFIRFVPNLTTMLINNKGTKVCSCFRFNALFFNLEASLQPFISQVVGFISEGIQYSCQKLRTHFLLWTFEMRNMIFWELLS
jgi:hypothetical protein